MQCDEASPNVIRNAASLSVLNKLNWNRNPCSEAAVVKCASLATPLPVSRERVGVPMTSTKSVNSTRTSNGSPVKWTAEDTLEMFTIVAALVSVSSGRRWPSYVVQNRRPKLGSRGSTTCERSFAEAIASTTTSPPCPGIATELASASEASTRYSNPTFVAFSGT
eukprot:scaffold2853_cov246-Pinguiococcus_pyrenoidosus.AAC.5